MAILVSYGMGKASEGFCCVLFTVSWNCSQLDLTRHMIVLSRTRQGNGAVLYPLVMNITWILTSNTLLCFVHWAGGRDGISTQSSTGTRG